MLTPLRVQVIPPGYELCPVCRGYGRLLQLTFDQLPLLEVKPQHVITCQVCAAQGYRLPPAMTMYQLFNEV